jgi:hypothetical protein
MELLIKPTSDFEINGKGDAAAWATCDWASLTPFGGSATFATRIKALYSAKGIYFLFDCEDRKLTSTILEDGGALFNEDVVELFLQPDESQRLYLEYEVSPLDKQLLLLVPNDGRHFFGWVPQPHLEAERLPRHATSIRGGTREPHATVTGWSAEIFVPYLLMIGLGNVPPKKDTVWRGNFYRIDYDEKPRTYFAWCRDTGRIFHDFKHFGWLRFG